MIKKSLLITLFVLTFFLNVKSQIDTSFWFVAPDISQGLGDRPIFLYFNTYAQAATVKVSQPANGAFVPITKVIPANSIDSINLTAFIASIENSTANTVLNNGIYISATQNISALYAIKGTNNKEQYSLKGPKALGVDFYVPMQEFWNQAPATTPKSFSSIDIVASQNGTTVLITPKTNIIGHAANASYTISLQKGQTYSCQDTARSATTSLAGSIISSNNPIAISIQSSGLSQSGCLSSVGDQITSSTYIGTDYIVNKGTTSTEKIFVLATQNNTQITINDGSTTTHVSNFGENFIYTATQNITYVNANKPVYVLHVSGFGCKLSGAQLPPFFCAGTYTTAFTRTSSDSLALNIFTRTGFEGNFALNGNAALIPASAFTVVPGTSGNIKSARLYYNTATIPVGSHNVVTNTGDVFGLGSVNGSSVRGSSYAYLSEFTSYPSINAGSDFTICANSNVALTGQIGGGNVTGIWATNGFGTFNGGFTALTNTYTPSQLDTTVKPVKIFLTSSGPCAQKKDTLFISVKPSPLVNASVDQIVCGNNSSVLLAGTVAGGSSTGIWSSTGSGTFTPNNTTLNTTYLPSSADTAAGLVKLVLTSTTNGICPLARDTMKVTITDVPTANAGPATASVCANNPNVTLSGTIGGASSTGKWTSTGTGNFSPSNIQLNTGYIPSTADVLAGQVKLYLTSTSNGSCLAAKDSITIIFTSSPSVNAGSDLYVCKNKISSVLSGSVSGATTTGIWSGGTGTFTPNNTVLTATYTPSAAELSAGLVNLSLTSTGNGSCNSVNDQVLIIFNNAPLVNAGLDVSSCKNNAGTALSGVVSGTTTTGIWTGGAGSFSPSNTNLNATYTPNAAELAAGSVTLTLTSTSNANCNAVTDNMIINFTPSPVVNAGVDLSVCQNNPLAVLSGSVSGGSTTGIWSGGNGTFNPSNSVLTASYTPSASELSAGSVTLTLTSTNNGNCNAVNDNMVLVFTPAPVVNAGANLSSCKNNPATVLSGTVSGATTTGIWSGGSGTFSPSNTALTTTYTPSAAELSAGTVNLILSSTANGNCSTVSDNVLIVFTNPPSVNAGVDLSICKNNPTSVLSGIVSGTTTTGIWSGGAGSFSPSNTNLNATYTPNAAELAAGSVTLTLTSTSNANCNAVTDNMIINFTPSPVVNAGVDLSVCQNNAVAVLSGSVSGGSTTGIWSGGNGTFNPSNSVLTASYTPSASELSAGSVTLTLTSTNNGNCNQVTDNIIINFTPAPIVNAGANVTICKNNPSAVLTGSVSGGTTTGIWTGGAGTFNPSNTDLNATYIPTASELSAGSLNLVLSSTSNGNCNQVSDNVLIIFTNPPSINAGVDLNTCKNNPTSILSGVVSGVTTTGIWSGGSGTFSPSNTSLNASYNPSAADLSAGTVTLTLTSTNNSNCNAVTDNMIINFTPSPVVNAGVDFSICRNNPSSVLSGSVSGGTTSGIWSGGLGIFNPSNSVLTATYTPNSTELTAGTATLILSSTNNGNCLQVRDTVVVSFSPAPVVNAGSNLTICKNNPNSVLTGSVSGGTTTGIWTGGSGTFNPSNTDLNATYIPSASELAAGSVNLVLSSTNNGNCNQVIDNVLIIFTNPPSVNAGVDLITCKNNAYSALSGFISGPTTTGIWTGGTGVFSPTNTALTSTYTPSAGDLVNGFVTLYLTSTNNLNCNQVIDSLKITYTNAPTVSAGTDVFACKNNAFANLSGMVSGPTTTGIWTGGSGSYNPSNTALTTTYTPNAAELAAGSVTLVLNSTNNGNCIQNRDTVVVNFTNPATVNAGVDLYSCKNNANTLLSGIVSGATTTGIWTGGTGTFNPNNTDLNAIYIPSAAEVSVGFVNLTLTSTNNGNCLAISDLIKLNFLPKPFANFNFNNVCLNNTTNYSDFSLAGIGTITDWEWSFGDNTTSTLQNPSNTFTTSGTYTTQLVVKNSFGCYDTIEKTPTVYPLPQANFGISRVCNGDILNLNFSDSSTVSSPETVNQWNWYISLPGGVQSNLQNPSQLFPGSGLYNIRLIAISNHNCRDTIEKQVNITPRPSAGFSYSVSTGINVGTTVSFVDTSSYSTGWSWNFGNANNPGTTQQNPSTIYFENGLFIVTQVVSDDYGCTDTAKVAIRINNVTTEISTLIPNAISPNGDGKNDVWKLDFLQLLYPDVEIDIYNRWGENIFNSKGYETPWDGTYNGSLLPVGTYYYVINLNDAIIKDPLKGGILLIR